MRRAKKKGNVGQNDKSKLELDDLKRVLSAVFDDRQILTSPARINDYLSSDRSSLIAATHTIPLSKLNVVTEPRGKVYIGGGGIVLQCANKTQPSIKYALKIPRPSLFQGRGARVEQNFQATIDEYLKHAPLSHENVARVFGAEKMLVPDKDGREVAHFAILMEWIEGATPLNKYLEKPHVEYRTIVSALTQCFQALAYIHSQALIHWDVKSDNLLVSKNGAVKLTDIGNARRSNDAARNDIAFSTRGNLPPKLLDGTDDISVDSSRRMQIRLPSLQWDSPWIDLWMLARELNRLFDASSMLSHSDWRTPAGMLSGLQERSTKFIATKFFEAGDDARFALKFLQLIIARLLYPSGPSEPACYSTSDTVVRDIGKLLPEFGHAQSVPELQAIPQRVLRIPNSGNAPWTPRVSSLVNGAAIQRLRRHKQLGAVGHVYPGASHLRIEHVVGVLSTVAQYVRALYADHSDAFWRLAMDADDIDALLLAALLHDVGHTAFGHYIEEMDGLIRGRSHVDYVLLLLEQDLRNSDASKTRFGTVNRNSAEADARSVGEAITHSWNVPESRLKDFLHLVADILRPMRVNSDEGNENIMQATAARSENAELDPALSRWLKIGILHSIIDSAIDADKLDYLVRDAHHCGVHYPLGIDIDRFYQSLTAIPVLSSYTEKVSDEKHSTGLAHASIGVTEKGLLPVESMLVARYQMFSCVYWHHTARAYTAMLQFLILSYLEAAKTPTETETRLDDVIRWFRDLDDEEALLWLKESLTAGLSGERRSTFSGIAEGILGRDRSLLYRMAFELRYEPGTDGTARQIYNGLMDISREAATAENPAAYVNFCRTIRTTLVALLSNHLEVRTGKTVNFTDGEVLIDIPPAGKDQVQNVFVTSDRKIRAVQEMSPLADAVSDAFRYWVRKPRIFLSPSAWGKCRDAGIRKAEVWDACFSALTDKVVLQLRLPLKTEGQAT